MKNLETTTDRILGDSMTGDQRSELAAPSEREIDAGAAALRRFEMGGRLLRKWSDLPNSAKRKWRDRADAVLSAAKAEGRR